MDKLKITYVPIGQLKPSEYNPRKATAKEHSDLKESINRFGFVDPVICNSAPGRENIVIGGHFRLRVARELNIKTAPVVYVNIADSQKEKELNLRLNRNLGEWDWDLLKGFETDLLTNVGFDLDELLSETEMQETKILPPPELVWILIRTTPEKFAKIADFIESLPAEGQEVFITYTGKDDGKKG